MFHDRLPFSMPQKTEHPCQSFHFFLAMLLDVLLSPLCLLHEIHSEKQSLGQDNPATKEMSKLQLSVGRTFQCDPIGGMENSQHSAVLQSEEQLGDQ
jgi:hypothetical protein